MLGASFALVVLAGVALVGLALLSRGGGPVADVGPGYPDLSPTEVAETERRAREVAARLDLWWTQQFRAMGLTWQPTQERLTDGDDDVECNGKPVVADDDLLDNAYVEACRRGPVVAYDPGTFRRDDIALQVILAHEWGHVAQAQHPPLDELVAEPDARFAVTELQADCFAGVWAADHLDGDDLDLAARQLFLIGDPPDVPRDDPDGHGTGDEREAAFRLGVTEGIASCLPERFDAA